MKWNRDKQSGIYTSDNKRWNIASVDKKWVLKDTKNYKEYKGATLKSMQSKALEIESLEASKKKVTKVVKKEEVVKETPIVKEEPKEEIKVEKKEINPEDIIIKGAEKFESLSKEELDKPKTLSNGLDKFIPVQGKILK